MSTPLSELLVRESDSGSCSRPAAQCGRTGRAHTMFTYMSCVLLILMDSLGGNINESNIESNVQGHRKLGFVLNVLPCPIYACQ